jgi:VRR-NUC domain.
MHKRHNEATEQETLIQWCGWKQSKYPELKLIYHIPNGGSRNAIEAANLKRQGVKAGVPDLCLPVARNGFHGLYIEMKYGRNKTTEKQKEWLKSLEEQGYFTVVCYGAEEAERIIARYLEFPGYPAIKGRAIQMIDFIEGSVPEALCTIDRDGDADDFVGCGRCFEAGGEENADCGSCIVSKVFQEYAVLTGQAERRGLKEYDNPKEVTVEKLIEILEAMDPKAIVISGREKNIKVYPGRETKEGGRNVVILC